MEDDDDGGVCNPRAEEMGGGEGGECYRKSFTSIAVADKMRTDKDISKWIIST